MKLNSLEIKAFRGIRDLTLEDFQDVNLLLGDNDAGKTTVLEAIILSGVRNNINEVIRSSRERLLPLLYALPPRSRYSPLESFYSMFPFSDEPEKNIELSMTSEKGRYDMRLEGQLMLTESYGEEFDDNPEEFLKKPEEIRVFEGTCTVNGNSETFQVPENYRYKVPVNLSSKTSAPIVALWPSSHLNRPTLRNGYSTKERERKTVEIMRLIDPDIEGIKLNQGAIGVHEVIEHRRFGEVFPFTYGDGMKKILALADVVASAEGGTLLIDEIETSLQSSLLSDVFTWLMKACKEMGVQLFATTHSLEAISVLTSCAMENPDISLAAYRLERQGEKIKARRFSKIALNKLVNGSGMDVR